MSSEKMHVFSEDSDVTVVPLFLFLGWVGSGKSTIARAVAEYLNSIGCPAGICDGDHMFGLSMSDVMRTKAERQPLTIWEVAKTVMEGRVPVISSGGGVYTNWKTKKQILTDHLEKFFPNYHFVFHVFVPYVHTTDGVSAIQPMGKDRTSYVEELMALYVSESDAHVAQVVADRIARGEWSKTTPVGAVLKASKGNKRFAKDFLHNAYKSYKFPTVGSGMFDVEGNFIADIDMSALAEFEGFTFEPPATAHYHQKRLLVDPDGSSSFGHITLGFIPHSKSAATDHYPLEHGVRITDGDGGGGARGTFPKPVPMQLVTTQMVLADPESKTKLPKKGASASFFLVTGKDSRLVLHPDSGVPKTHVTVNATSLHFPAQVGDLAAAMNAGESSMTLKSKNGTDIVHTFKVAKEVDGTFVVPFLIP